MIIRYNTFNPNVIFCAMIIMIYSRSNNFHALHYAKYVGQYYIILANTSGMESAC